MPCSNQKLKSASSSCQRFLIDGATSNVDGLQWEVDIDGFEGVCVVAPASSVDIEDSSAGGGVSSSSMTSERLLGPGLGITGSIGPGEGNRDGVRGSPLDRPVCGAA